MPTPTYDLIEYRTLTTSTNNASFTNIPQTYRDLIIVMWFSPSSATRPLIRMNGSTSSHTEAVMFGDGTSTSTVNYNNQGFDPLNRFSSYTTAMTVTMSLFDYTNTDRYKQVLFRGNGHAEGVILGVGRWANTSAVTSVDFVSSSGGNWPTDTTIALYGIVS